MYVGCILFIFEFVLIDRYVLVGNHLDAWTLGGIDPASGTSVLLEIARSYGRLKEKSSTVISN